MISKIYNSYKEKQLLYTVIVVFVLSLTITQVLSIKCYQCKEPDPRCRDPFQNDTAFFKPCPANATKCRKYKWESKCFDSYFLFNF